MEMNKKQSWKRHKHSSMMGIISLFKKNLSRQVMTWRKKLWDHFGMIYNIHSPEGVGVMEQEHVWLDKMPLISAVTSCVAKITWPIKMSRNSAVTSTLYILVITYVPGLSRAEGG